MKKLPDRLRPGLPRSVHAPAAVVLVAGALLSLVLGTVVQAAQRRSADAAIDRRAVSAQATASAELQRYVDALRMTADDLAAGPDPTRAGFEEATRPLEYMRLRGATSIMFIASVPTGGVAEAQRLWRSRGATGLELTPAAGHDEQLFVVLRRPLEDASPSPLGVNVAPVAEPAGALRRSRATGAPAVSDPYVLLRDRTLPKARQRLSFVLAAPVTATGGEQAGQLRGWVVIGVRGADFLASTVSWAQRSDLHLTLEADGTEVVRLGREHEGMPYRQVSVPVADRRWRLTVGTELATLTGGGAHLGAVMTTAGLLVTLLLAVLVNVLAGARARAHAQVEAATAELRRTEAEARHQAALLTTVLDTIGDGVAVVDETGRFLLHNPAATAIAGTPDDMEDPADWQSHFGIFTPGGDPFPTARLPMVRALAGRSSDQTPMVIRGPARSEGTVVSVSARPLELPGGRRGAVAVFHDVTERTRAEERVRSSEERLQLLLDGARDHAIVMLDTEGVVRSWSANARRLTGYAEEEIVGRGAEVLFIPEDIVAGEPRRLVREAAATGRAEFEGPRVRRDGTRFWAHCILSAVRHADGSLRGFVMVTRDNSERRQAAQAIEELNADLRRLNAELGRRVAERTAQLQEQAERLRHANAELEAFSYSVSHDLRAPLRSVDGFAKMLMLDHSGTLDESGRRYLNKIRDGAQRMGQLIDGLLAFSRLQRQSMAFRPVAMDELVAEAWRDLAAERADRDVTLTVGDLPAAHADPGLMRHVLTNLLGNAVKYTRGREGARVRVDAVTGPGGRVVYRVADNGVGFDMRYAGKLFQVFQRLHRAEDYEGTGIGLALAARVVRRHGGRIWAEAVPGEGATFSFSLHPDSDDLPTTEEPAHDAAA
ncbi:PAS domain S-box protein [Planomonospora corallina]|uniref:Sensor-like histidine kinase SenX3 n=1 Tax=Planomonospora corallina TaxID=1806052 RepID=A0ABV8IBP5_9ACTN